MVIFFVLTRQFSLYLHFHTLFLVALPCFARKTPLLGTCTHKLRKISLSVEESFEQAAPCGLLSFPSQIEGTKKLLNKDLGELINKMRLAQQNAITSLKEECQRQMLAAAHTLALDSKNLLDAVDQARVRANLAKPKPDSEEGGGSAE